MAFCLSYIFASMFHRFGIVFRLVLDAQMTSGGGGPIMLIGLLGPPGRSRGCLGPLRWSSWGSGSVLGCSEALLGVVLVCSWGCLGASWGLSSARWSPFFWLWLPLVFCFFPIPFGNCNLDWTYLLRPWHMSTICDDHCLTFYTLGGLALCCFSM